MRSSVLWRGRVRCLTVATLIRWRVSSLVKFSARIAISSFCHLARRSGVAATVTLWGACEDVATWGPNEIASPTASGL